MSGGYYEYLYSKDIENLMKMEEQLQQMADDLAMLGYASDAAKETEDFLLTIRAFRNRMTTRLDRLWPVWKAMEWWKSYDSGEDAVQKSLREYRGEQGAKTNS